MKLIFCIVIVSFFAISCSGGSDTREIKIVITQNENAVPTSPPIKNTQPSSTQTQVPTNTLTQKPSITHSPFPSMTQTPEPTIVKTPKPSITQSPEPLITHTPEPSIIQVNIMTVNKREEWVDIQNVGNIDVNLSGWNLVSEKGNQDCPLSGIIEAGHTLRIWAMAGHTDGYSCGYNTNIWNNSEPDPAVLYNAEGEEVSRK